MENTIDDFVANVVEAYKLSDYPSSSFNFCIDDYFQLHIRHPPSIPQPIVLRYSDTRERLRASPSIERIMLADELCGQGIFRKLVNSLGDLPYVDCVCVANVGNVGFSDYLSASPEWAELDGGADKSFYRMF